MFGYIEDIRVYNIGGDFIDNTKEKSHQLSKRE